MHTYAYMRTHIDYVYIHTHIFCAYTRRAVVVFGRNMRRLFLSLSLHTHAHTHTHTHAHIHTHMAEDVLVPARVQLCGLMPVP